MAGLRITFKDDNVGALFKRSMRREASRVDNSLRETAHEAGREILRRGRPNIAGAGRFGRRWTEGLRAFLEREDGDYIVAVSHDVPYFIVFQQGAIIRGRPLLWIPLSFAQDAQGKRARDYPGGLFRVNRKSGKAPLLLSRRTAEPKYFGKESVTIPKKFRIVEICREVSREMRQMYAERFAANG